MFRLSTSADKRNADNSKVVRVRVEFSKNRLTMVLPCKRGTFLVARLCTLKKRLLFSALPALKSALVCRLWLAVYDLLSGAASWVAGDEW